MKLPFTKRTGAALLGAGLFLGLLVGCGGQPSGPAETTPLPEETAVQAEPADSIQTTTAPTAEPAETAEQPEETPETQGEIPDREAELMESHKGFTDFDSTLIAFLEESGYRQENFMVSPLSFRAALALAVSGADGSTREALLHAMGFSDMGEVVDWYGSLLEGVKAFREGLEQEKEWMQRFPEDYAPGDDMPDRAYSIANSIWHNGDMPGGFLEDYAAHAKEWFDAAVAEAPGAELTDAVNNWVNEQTNGMIPGIAGDLSQMDAVLVNALYLRTSWINSFSEYATAPGTFTTFGGEEVEKDFMRQKEHLRYYADGDTELVILPMKGGIQAAFVLGDTENIQEKLDSAAWQEVIVKLPKFELETSLDKRELTGYLERMGAGEALTDAANFSAMSEIPWYIGDIIQKSKIKVDEDGIEAAAVTAILMEAAAAEPPAQPVEFTADHPFTFYLYTDANGESQNPELLFYGQYLE